MLQVEDAKYLKKKIKVGSLDVHPVEKALVINYELEATILGQMGDPMLGDKKECQKIIRLKSLTRSSDVASLAREVVEKCSLIHPSKISEVQHLIQFLKTRKEVPTAARAQKDKKIVSSTLGGTSKISQESNQQKATLNDLETYMEMLYEDIPEKVKGASHVLQLARNPDFLEELCHNEAALGALARVLREDWKKSLELSYNIVYIFFCFSVFSNFHSVVSHFKIGSLCMDIIEGELESSEASKDQLTKKKTTDFGSQKHPQELEKSPKVLDERTSQQDQVLRVCTYLLLNIAEDIKVEEKMRRKNIVSLLVKMLQRESTDLLLLVVSFLKKLSAFAENKDDMADLNIIDKVAKLMSTQNEDLLNMTIRLLLNLSFDEGLRGKMIKAGLLPKLVQIMGNDRHQQAVVALLYHLSVDDKCKSLFTYTDCIPILMKSILSSNSSEAPLELMALAVNLAMNKKNAQLICEGAGLKLIMKKAFKTRDSLLMKMIRNIAQHEGPIRTSFTNHVNDLCSVVSEGNCDEFVLECVGVLGNLSLPDLDYSKILTEYNFLNWILNNLKGDTPEDLILEVIVLVGTVATDENAAQLLVDAGILDVLVTLLNAKQEDDEMVLQIAYVFYQITRHESTRPNIVTMTEVPAYLIDLMHDNNIEIRKVCDATLDIIAEEDGDWATRIQCHKFRWYNSQWLDMVEEAANLDSAGGEEAFGSDSLGQSFLHDSDVLGTHGVALYHDGLSSSESDDYPGWNGLSDSSRSSSARVNE